MGRVLWPLGLMGALGLAIGISARSCGQPAPAMAPAPLRSEPPPDLASAPPPDFVGVLVLGYAVDVTPRLEGKVEAVFVHPGDRVKAGTPLAHVDLAKTREELEMARAELLALRAEEL